MKFLTLSLSDVIFIMLINVEMPTIVDSLTFMSMIYLSSAELSMKKVLLPRGHCCQMHFINDPATYLKKKCLK